MSTPPVLPTPLIITPVRSPVRPLPDSDFDWISACFGEEDDSLPPTSAGNASLEVSRVSAVTEPSQEVVGIGSSATEGEGGEREEERGEEEVVESGRRNEEEGGEDNVREVAEREERGPSGYSRRGRSRSTRRTRRQVEEEPPFVLPPDSEEDEATDILPSRLRLSEDFPEYVREADDFVRISEWVANLPRSGRSRYERALRGVVTPTAIAGGRVWNCFGEGEADLGPMGVDVDGSNYNWEPPTLALEAEMSSRRNWEGMRLSDVLPAGFLRCFARYEGNTRLSLGISRSPRSFWSSPVLSRTSRTRCVACLARELAFHEEDRATMAHYMNCLRGAETERWRRMRPSTRTIFFRQHSCFFGSFRERRWHGLVTALQRDVLGGSMGWVASFRVYVTATIPAGHPEMYRRGTTRIDVVFPFPRPFHVLLGPSIRMTGQLNWEGSRASRAQPMSLLWVPFPGDGEGLSGPVAFRRWVFETDFWYADRPDVMLSALTLQFLDITARDIDTIIVPPASHYTLTRAARELRRRKNNKCVWWEGKKTGRWQRLSDDEDEERAPRQETLGEEEVQAMRRLSSNRQDSLPPSSAAPPTRQRRRRRRDPPPPPEPSSDSEDDRPLM